MGYFSNGTEGDMYQSEYCIQCTNWKEPESDLLFSELTPRSEEGCPIWDIHLLWNYEAHGATAGAILDHLIPRSEDELSNEQCRMFRRD